MGRKLKEEIHMTSIKEKLDFLNFRLIPLLSKIFLDYRINLWKLLVSPLFNPVLENHMKGNTRGRRNSWKSFSRNPSKNLLASTRKLQMLLLMS